MLSPSGPARRFAEPDLGLNCLYDQSQTFLFLNASRNTLLTFCMLILFFRILFCHHNKITAMSSLHPITGHYRSASETPVCLISNTHFVIGAYWVQARTVWIQIRLQVLSKIVS